MKSVPISAVSLPASFRLCGRVDGRDKLALPAGGQDKSPPVTPPEWHLGSQAPGPLPLGKTGRGSSLGRQGLGQGSLGQKERRDQGSARTAQRRIGAPGQLCGVLGGEGLGESHVQRGPETTPETSRLVPHPRCALGGQRHGWPLTSWSLGVRRPHLPGFSLSPPPSPV